jgi:hypothetical protein
MRHLNDYELVDHYYGEADDPAYVANHLRECGDCARSYAALMRDLSEIQPLTPPERSADYGSQVWQSIRSSVAVYEKKKNPLFSFNLRTGLSFATACIVLISAAFFAGRHWERRNSPPPVVVADNNNSQVKQRVVLLVIGDHLDRSERLLVALRHGDADTTMQAEARDLLSSNRLYRESASQAGDPALTAALEHLECVLVEISNQPDGVTPARLAELQKEMNTDGLLFEVRVLRSRVQESEQKETAGSKGVSI